MDKLSLRILDALVDDEEQLEEVYLTVNFSRRDNLFLLYREHFRLLEVLDRLTQLERDGLVSCRSAGLPPSSTDPLTGFWCITDKGRQGWMDAGDTKSHLYDV
jgi:hypothetical protein